MSGRRAVFLDKDGTVIENAPYNVDPVQIRLLPGAAVGLRRLHRAGYLLVVISNQSGVAKGYFAERDLAVVERRLRDVLRQEGVPLAGFFYCPHHPEGLVPEYTRACSCRKPQPGLVWNAACDLEVDVARSWLVGDILHDIEAGQRAGCRTVLVDNGGETEWTGGPFRTPHAVVTDLEQAAAWILAADGPHPASGVPSPYSRGGLKHPVCSGS